MSEARIIQLGRHEADLKEFRKVTSPNGAVSRESVVVGTINAELELLIDTSKIPWHKIQRALLAKTKRTVTNGGLVVIRVKSGTEKMIATPQLQEVRS